MAFGENPRIVLVKYYTPELPASSMLMPAIPQHSNRPSEGSPSVQKRIEFNFEEVPDSIRRVATLAADYWSNILQNEVPIKLNLSMSDDLGENLMLTSPIFYCDGTLKTPLSLHIQHNINPVPEYAQAYIFLNKNKEWNCNIELTHHSPTNNLYSYLLRAIPVCLGFGMTATLYDSDKTRVRDKRYPKKVESAA